MPVPTNAELGPLAGLAGSWEGDQIGSVYGTAIGTLVLTLPYRYLPIYQK
jgi:hypothetical protein